MSVIVRPHHVVVMVLAVFLTACGKSPPSSDPTVTQRRSTAAVSGTLLPAVPSLTQTAVQPLLQTVTLPSPQSPSPGLPFPLNIRIAYSQSTTEAIYVVRQDGSELTPIAGPGPANWCSYPDWSPDGTQLAFECFDTLTGNADIYKSDPLGTSLKRLTTGEAFDTQPVWSPDGQRIAFRSEPNTYPNTHGWDLVVLDITLPSPTTVASIKPNDTGATDAAFDWSPDSQQLVFYHSQERRLYVVNADGTGLARLSPSFGSEPDWSPIDNKIAYVGEDGVRVIDLESQRDLIAIPGRHLFTPKWSPDARNLAAVEFSDDAGLYVHNPESHETQQFLKGTHVHGYCWTPDSLHIVFVGSDFQPATWSIYVLDTSTAEITWVGPVDLGIFDNIACQP